MNVYPQYLCPRCGNWKTYNDSVCSKCYQDDLKKAIIALNKIVEAADTINMLIAEDTSRYEIWVQEANGLYDATVDARSILTEIEEVKS